MRYQDPQLRENLAGEYVLGALQGAARSRFEQLMQRDPDLQQIVVRWQEDLTPLSEATPEVQPPPRLLENLKRGIAPQKQQEKPGLWQRLNLWRPIAAINFALVIALAGYLGFQTMHPPETEEYELMYVGVLSDRQKQPAVAVLAYNEPWRLAVESKNITKPDTQSELRLWIADKDSGTHQFLTVIPSDRKEIRLNEQNWKLLENARSLIVSQAPVGSAAEQPSGTILYSGVCINLKNWSAQEPLP